MKLIVHKAPPGHILPEGASSVWIFVAQPAIVRSEARSAGIMLAFAFAATVIFDLLAFSRISASDVILTTGCAILGSGLATFSRIVMRRDVIVLPENACQMVNAPPDEPTQPVMQTIAFKDRPAPPVPRGLTDVAVCHLDIDQRLRAYAGAPCPQSLPIAPDRSSRSFPIIILPESRTVH